MTTARKLATYEDLLGTPEDQRVELIRGQMDVLPAPRPRHSKPQRSLGRFIGGPFDDDDGHGGPGGWWIFVEVDVAFGPHDVLRPDLSGWRRERLPDPDQPPISIAPDWVCEILSPSTAARDTTVKKRLYAEHGVAHYWLIDPDRRTLEALALVEGRWVDVGSYGDEDAARIPPFEAVELSIGRLFLPKPASDAKTDATTP